MLQRWVKRSKVFNKESVLEQNRWSLSRNRGLGHEFNGLACVCSTDRVPSLIGSCRSVQALKNTSKQVHFHIKTKITGPSPIFFSLLSTNCRLSHTWEVPLQLLFQAFFSLLHLHAFFFSIFHFFFPFLVFFFPPFSFCCKTKTSGVHCEKRPSVSVDL